MHAIARGKLAWVGFVVLAIAARAQAQSPGAALLRIESTPSAAEVELIGGRAGTTPVVVTERDLYPNDYPDARAAMYGMVLLRHPGCESLQHRVTLSDFKQGLHLHLDCTATAVRTHTAAAPPEAHSLAAPPPLESPKSVSQQRLRQLQVLQELLDEGLISPAEEQRVRRRILKLGGQLLD